MRNKRSAARKKCIPSDDMKEKGKKMEKKEDEVKPINGDSSGLYILLQSEEDCGAEPTARAAAERTHRGLCGPLASAKQLASCQKVLLRITNIIWCTIGAICRVAQFVAALRSTLPLVITATFHGLTYEDAINN